MKRFFQIYTVFKILINLDENGPYENELDENGPYHRCLTKTANDTFLDL